MKVILTRDVKDIGRMNEVVTVADGHGLNFLIPRGFAISATSASLKTASMRQKQVVERKALEIKLLTDAVAALADAHVTIKAKANDKGHLYDGIGAAEIAAAVKSAQNIDIPEDAIRVEKPFKEIGTFDVPVSAGEDFGKFSITIEAEA